MRDTIRNPEYFNEVVDFYQKWVREDIDGIKGIARPDGKAMSANGLCEKSIRVAALRYSRGDAIATMRDTTLQMAEMLKLRREVLASVTLEPPVRTMYERLDLGTLYENLTCLAFMTALRFSLPERLQALGWIGHAGEDALLDRVAVLMGENGRKVAAQSKYPPVYDSLVAVVDADAGARKAMLEKYVGGWYKRMKPIYWHNSHKGAEGAYFGYWCFEAALVSMLLEIDDDGLRGHPNYPADLVEHYRRTA